MRRPAAWFPVAVVNLSAMTLFLWHQTAFITVSTAGLLAGRVPGLLTAPATASWIAERLAWLPVFAVALSGLWLAFHRMEHGPRHRARPAEASTALRTHPPVASPLTVPIPGGRIPDGPIPGGARPSGARPGGPRPSGLIPGRS
jgi:hypothetical protein